ncbi:uncharacterized protein GGS22DRAFT_169763 [Annulohypoxylon maeteangense]|uniref:uncharacterized protein n=1 Tax=Annulohypoxylon maeteangense TaxID=1927788 RepID=UPI002007F4FD|nr:uncharacterized protein GGS22DRAFT_169763 [Annulohypoxylon maeteangense]KAI0882566.1 hypothetical protein GGS22DRAFT_169763 [Annulohypoxylon maeteangense]
MSAPAVSSPSTSASHALPNPSVPETLSATPSAQSSNVTASPNSLTSPTLSPSLQSGSSRPQPSNSGSTSRSATSPPTTTTATASAATGSQPRVTMDLNPTLPSRATQLHIDEARVALVASMSNMLDSELQSRASLLHSNAAALTKQEKDVAKGTEALRKENDKLEKLARDTERKIKELGNVQNWAEVLERDFLVLEETMRLVREGSGSGDDSCSECSGSSWTGSYSAEDSRAGSRRGSVTGDADGNIKKAEERELNGHTAVDGAVDGGKLKERDDINVTVDKAVAESILEAMATDLREPLSSLTLNPVSSESQGSSVKGKEPAVSDSGIEVDNAHKSLEPPEPVQPSDTPPADTVEDVTANKDITDSTTTG